ncbi:MAG: hypothetical protein H6670_18195 [Anaerolineaceae bacterium]|nr:hypothetical protein [Anaerolineae bacterium]MCB9461592.1 hypothetical protein [Anaerolineaceae bacterium]
MKQQRTLVILVAVLAIVLIAGALQTTLQNRVEVAPTATPIEATYLFNGWGPNSVFAVNIYEPVAQVGLTITKNNDNLWELVEFSGMLTQEEGDVVAGSMAYFPVLRSLGALEMNRYNEFGLGQNDLTMIVSVILIDGTEHSIAVGDITATTDGFYALVDEDPTLYVVDARPIAYFTSLLRRAYE